MRNIRIMIIEEVHPLLMDKFDAFNSSRKGVRISCDYFPVISKKELSRRISGYDGIILRSTNHLDAGVLAEATQLQFIGKMGSGMDNIDTEFAKRKKIELINVPEGNRDAVGEHAVGVLLGLLRNIPKADRELRKYRWKREENRGTELGGMTVGIIGYGNTGQAFAKRLAGFGCRIVAFDKYRKNFSDRIVEEVSLFNIFRETDILSLHIPLTKETLKLVDYQFINRFRKNIIFLNMARGEIVDMKAVCKAIERGKIRAAGLDVFENENLDSLNAVQKKNFDFLVKRPDVILTPHIAGWTFQSKERLADVMAEKITRFLLKKRR